MRAGEPLVFTLRTRDRFGNDRWSGGDAVRVMVLRAPTPGGIGKVMTKAEEKWGGLVQSGVWTPASRLGEANEGSAGASETADCMSSVDDGAGRDGGGRYGDGRPAAARGSARRASEVHSAAEAAAASEASSARFQRKPPPTAVGQRTKGSGSSDAGASSSAGGAPTSQQLAAGLGKAATAPGGRNAWGVVETEASTGGANASDDLAGAGSAFFAAAGAEQSLELLEMRGASSSGCEVADHADGLYTLTALATTAGKYTVHAFVNERPAMAPWPFVVRPSMPDASTSELCVGATRGLIGRWVPLMILTRDVYGNITDSASLLPVRSDNPEAEAAGGTASAEAMGGGGGDGVRRDGGIEIHVVGGEGRAMPVEALGEGRYESAVVSPVAGLLRVAVTIAGLHLRGSPFELQVNAGKSAASQSYAEGTGWQHRVLVGEDLNFTIHAHDAQGNPQNRPIDHFVVTLTPRARGNNAQQLRPAYLGGGCTLVEYNISAPGSYVLSVTLKGFHIRESPLNLVAGSGFFSDHLAQHREPPSAPNNVDLLTERHARSAGGGSSRAQVRWPEPPLSPRRGATPRPHARRARPATAPPIGGGPSSASGAPPYPLHRSSTGDAAVTPEGSVFFMEPGAGAAAQRLRTPKSAERARQAEYARAQIREVRKRAVARGLLLGAEPPLRPPISPALAFEATASAIRDARAVAAAEVDLPPRALWERERAKAAAAFAAAEAASPRRSSSLSSLPLSPRRRGSVAGATPPSSARRTVAGGAQQPASQQPASQRDLVPEADFATRNKAASSTEVSSSPRKSVGFASSARQ